MKLRLASSYVLFCTLTLAAAAVVAEPRGETTLSTSPRGQTEKCIALTKLPGGIYSDKDVENEKEYCAINFYNNSVALCPKTWSTSPGTIVHDAAKSGKTSVQAEASDCGRNSKLKSIAKFKQTMNRADTSGTRSESSILYYHLSRLLNVTVDVPTAVYRSMDKNEHYQRVSSKAHPAGGMIANGWNALRQAELNPDSYNPTADLFTADRLQIYGVMFKDRGERYEVEFNGTRASGWGVGQNKDFQKTAPFEALKSDQDLPQAISAGISRAVQESSAMAKAYRGTTPSNVQMALWMRELTEISILDYILSQQDRIGNIDYRWYWIFQDASGKIRSQKDDSSVPRANMGSIKVPSEIAAFHPVLVQKTSIGDNDAGGSPSYANFTKQSGMLQNIRHINVQTYARLVRLSYDLSARGEIYQNLEKNFSLKHEQLAMLTKNSQEAAGILISACESQKLKFDLVTFQQVYRGEFGETRPDCRNP
jgi:hypothetical protein